MSLYTYVDTPNSNLVCCICRTPFTDPTTTLTCAHTFCRECILRALSHASLCPVDRSPLSEQDLVPADPIVRSLVEELEVECVHRISGCRHRCQRQLLAAHLRDDCVYGQLECDEAGCEEVVTRAELQAHRREAHEEREGSKAEDVEVAGIDKDDNQVASTSKAKDAEASLAPPHVDKEVKAMELLREQNILLRHRVELLEGAMQVMKKEMGAMRSALAPWFRLPAQSQPQLQRPRAPQRTEQNISPTGLVLETTGEVSHDNNRESNGPPAASSSSVAGGIASASQAHGASRLPQPVSEQGQGHRSLLSLPGDIGISGIDPLAGYFPTLSEFGMYPSGAGGLVPLQAQHGPHGGHMQQQQSQPPPPVGGLQINPQAVTRVAPLDLGTNLLGTLEGLRESVVGVAAGVDSLGRRSEIALANETLRLGEEVISLRAGVHGLRMQIHAMMMERNAQVTGREEGTGVGGSWMGAGGIGFGVGAQGTNVNTPAVPPRMYPYAGPPSITKL